MAEYCPPDRADLVDDRRLYFLLWGVPRILLIASFRLNDSLKTAIWTGALTQMGTACLVNASGCRRLHCYFTGPFYMAGALASLLRGLGTIRLSWGAIGLAMLLGGLILGRLPEMVWGKYAGWGGR